VSLFIDPIANRCAKPRGSGLCDRDPHGFLRECRGQEKGKGTVPHPGSRATGRELGLRIHAGHGLNYENIFPLLNIPGIIEFNIGHSIISRAIFVGIARAVQEMKRIISGK